MFKLKNVAKLLIIFGTVTVVIQVVFLFSVYCENKGACLAGVYFGLPQYMTEEVSINMSDMSGMTPAIKNSSYFGWGETQTFIQLVGVYSILVGVFLMLFLEFKKLRFFGRGRLVIK